MLGIIVALLLSWGLIYFFERKSILALGLLPFPKRITQFFTGVIITGILCFLVQYLEAFLQSSSWVLNSEVSAISVLSSIWWDVKSVLTEELIFRGALLYILIQKIGARKSIFLSGVAFGVYHWFSYGVLGNVMAMILVFIGTGLMGVAWAWAFSKTKSIMLPFGLHLGWNAVYNSVFSKGPLGELLLISQVGHELTGWFSLLNFVTGLIIVPIFVLLYVHFFVKEEESEEP